MYLLRKLLDLSEAWLERLFPKLAHARQVSKWDKHWQNPNYNPFWKTDQPQKELVEAIEAGWFAKDGRVIDLGCGNGEVSRWLAQEGFEVIGVDYSSKAIANCRRLSLGQERVPTFQVADLCAPNLQLPIAAGLFDRGCFHRIADNCREVFVQNMARATVRGGHFLLLAGTFQRSDFAHYRGARSERELREHIESLFGSYFSIDRSEAGVINAQEGHAGMPAMAFWMTRRE
jgi:SAM-dependent methyltransferase